eukprot:8955069-Alexandrium_andersonii.AAC.1
MSASLVGSEMCIRDRSRPGSICSCPRQWRALAVLPSAVPRLHLTGRAAVSYTHLTLPTICSV